MATPFKIIYTKTFVKNLEKLLSKNQILKKKFLITVEKIKANPFQGEKVEASELGHRRIWVGRDHRLFYDINNSNIVLHYLKKKDKQTYR